MLHLALAQDVTASHLRAARVQRSSDTQVVLLQILRSAPGFLTGGPESDSKLAPQVQGAGQKAKPVPGPSMPQPLCWPGPQSLPHDHPTLTYYLNLRSENQLLFLSSRQRLTLQDMLLTTPLGSQTACAKGSGPYCDPGPLPSTLQGVHLVTAESNDIPV